MPATYKGELQIEPSDFILEAERLILNGDHVSFNLKGEDEDGQFEIEGRAARGEDGYFSALNVPYIYRRWKGNHLATIVFSELSINPLGLTVVGQWIGEGDSWKLYGTLREFSLK